MHTIDSELDFTGASIEESKQQDDEPARGEHARSRFHPQPAPSIQLPNQDADYVTHIALDIGGSLIKLVYFSPYDAGSNGDGDVSSSSPDNGNGPLSQSTRRTPSTQRGGKLHFVKFETSSVEEAISFIEAKGLHRYSGRGGNREMRVKATGGGAWKFADVFKERLGVVLEQVDEMACLVSGCNFLLKAIRHEAFTHEGGVTTFVPTNEDSDLYPYLLVNIGSGVSMVKVSGPNSFERVSGSAIGGGTFWGLCRLLTQRSNFDEMLELSKQGDNAAVDMLVGDIYGGRDYSAIGLSATTIASSFGKVVSQDKQLGDYSPADMALALCRMVAYNIAQLAHLNAMRHGIKRIFFGGFFIRGHPYTMETMSFAIRFWSKGETAAMFLRHEGFLGAVGAFLTVHPMVRLGSGAGESSEAQARKLRARFVERFSMGAPLTGGAVVGPAIRDVSEKVSWVEKFVAAASDPDLTPLPGTFSAPLPTGPVGDRAAPAGPGPGSAAAAGRGPGGEEEGDGAADAEAGPSRSTSVSGPGSGFGAGAAGSGSGAGGIPTVAGGRIGGAPSSSGGGAGPLAAAAGGGGGGGGGPGGGAGGGGGGGAGAPRVVPRMMSLNEPLPLTSPGSFGAYRPRMSLHVGVLHFSPFQEPFPLLADTEDYEPNTLDINADEEELRWWLCLLRDQIPTVVEKAAASEGGGEVARRRAAAFGRAFGAHLDKMQSEPGSYGALGLGELFEMREECLREFGFKDVYRREKERENAAALAALPDLLRELDAEPLPGRLLGLVEGVLAANIFDWGSQACVALYRDGTILDIYRTARLRLSKRPWAMDSFEAFAAKVMASFGGAQGDVPPSPPYRRVMMFVDNSGADVVLGMLPFARELLRLGCEVVLVANSLPAINDITAPELRQLLAAVAEVCPLIRAAREAAIRVEHATNGHVPPYPGLRPVRRSTPNFAALAGPRASPGSAAATGAAPSSSSRGEGEHPVACSAPAAAAVPIPPPHAALPSPPSPSPFSATAPPPSDAPSTHPSVQDPTRVTGPGPGPGPGAEPRPASPPAAPDSPTSSIDSAGSGGSGSSGSSGSCPPTPGARRSARPPAWHAAASDPAVNPRCPKLYVVANGQGSPCLDLRRVPDRLGEACVGVDLLVIEGMGRAIHTNFNARFTCDVLKLAMIKTERVAKKLFNGSIYDCVCIFDQPEQAQHA